MSKSAERALVEGLRRIGIALKDERILAIADEWSRGTLYVPDYVLGEPYESWGRRLDNDRWRSKGNRARERIALTSVEARERRSVEWNEIRRRYHVPDSQVLARAGRELPFVELTSEPHRRACVDELGGEDNVRAALAQYHRMFNRTREHLSVALAANERAETNIRQDRRELWELLVGARRVASDVRRLSAPRDVRVAVDAWHYRVIYQAVGLPNPHLPEWIKEQKRITKGKVITGPPSKLKNLRQRFCRELLDRHITPEQLAILETAWVVPVELADGKAVPVTKRSPSKHPERPRFDPQGDKGDARREVRRFFASRIKAARALRRAR